MQYHTDHNVSRGTTVCKNGHDLIPQPINVSTSDEMWTEYRKARGYIRDYNAALSTEEVARPFRLSAF